MLRPDQEVRLAVLQLLASWENHRPEVSNAEALRTQIIVHTALNQFADQLRKELAPIVNRVRAGAASDHIGTIQLKPSVKAWVSTQPDMLKQAYEQVIASGSAQEVIALVDTYKRVNGIGLTPQEQSTASQVATPVKSSVRSEEQHPSRSVSALFLEWCRRRIFFQNGF